MNSKEYREFLESYIGIYEQPVDDHYDSYELEGEELSENDLFNYFLEYLVSEGYADTNDAAIVIMANMSEDWKQSIIEGMNPSATPAAKQQATKTAIDFFTKPVKKVPPYEAKKPRFPALTVPDFNLGTEKPRSKPPVFGRDDGRTERKPSASEKPKPRAATPTPKPRAATPTAKPKPSATPTAKPYDGPGYKKDTSVQDMIDRSKQRQQQTSKPETSKTEKPRQPISTGSAGAEGVKFVEKGSSSAAGSPAKPVRDRMLGLSPRERSQMRK
jgi:hypothetical protein